MFESDKNKRGASWPDKNKRGASWPDKNKRGAFWAWTIKIYPAIQNSRRIRFRYTMVPHGHLFVGYLYPCQQPIHCLFKDRRDLATVVAGYTSPRPPVPPSNLEMSRFSAVPANWRIRTFTNILLNIQGYITQSKRNIFLHFEILSIFSFVHCA